MADEKTGQCMPSQVTINIGAAGVKVADGTAPDLSKYALKDDVPTKADLAGVETKADMGRVTASQAAADAVEALNRAKALEGGSKTLVIDPGFPVPAGTARGTLVVRPNTIMEAEHRQFAPVSAWPRFAGVTLENDGLNVPGAIGFQPSLEQMLPSIGTWQIDISYTWKPNFDEKEERIPVYNVRTWDEFGDGNIKQDEGQKLGELTLKSGEHMAASLRVKPTSDPKATGLWAPRIQAPAAGFVVHGVSVDYITDQS